MATTINNADETTGAGMVLGIVVAIIIIALILIYGIPALRARSGVPATNNSTNINLQFPSDTGSTTGTGTEGTEGSSGSGY